MTLYCHQCGAPWISDKKRPAVKEVCEACDAYLHCCMNCRFRDRHAPNECRVPNTNGVADRSGPNFCDEFECREGTPNPAAANKAGQARDAFANLFDAADADAADEILPGFDDLFQK